METLTSLKIRSDVEWSKKVEQTLKTHALSDQKEYTNKIFFNNFFMKNKIIFAGVAVVALATVALSVGSIFLIGRGANPGGFTKADTASFLAKVLANNATTSLRENASAQSFAADSSKMASGSNSLSIAPYYNDFQGVNYRYTKSTFTPGVAFESCGQNFSYERLNAAVETLEYRPNGGTNYKDYIYKSINYGPNNQIVNYYLNLYANNESISYEYAGGSYAVKNVYEQGPEVNNVIEPLVYYEGEVTSTDPASTSSNEQPAPDAASNSEQLVAQYFGTDAEIVRTEVVNGNTLYVLRYSYDSDCAGQNKKIVYENKINKDTFEITEAKSFVGSVSDANLISTSTTVIERKNLSLDEVDRAFKFTPNVTVKEIRYPYVTPEEYSQENETKKTIDALKGSSTHALFPTDNDYRLSYGYSFKEVDLSPAGSNYRTDRAFYPAGAIGDEVFNLSNPTSDYAYLNIESNWNFSTENVAKGTLAIESYKSGTTRDQIVKSKTQNYTQITDQTSTNTSILINGSNVQATVLKFKAMMDYTLFKDAISATPSVAPSSEGDERIAPFAPTEEQSYTYIIFEFSGHFYSISNDVYSGKTLNASDINLKSYNPNNASDASFLKTELSKVYEYIGKPTPVEGDGGIGDGSSGSTPDGIACTQEAMVCPDGSYVGRNSANNCAFDACPK